MLKQLNIKTIVRNHIAVTFFLGQGAMYAIAYLGIGPAGVTACGIVTGVGALFSFIYNMEKMSAEMRKDRSTSDRSRS
jgi:hypothetical protein